MKEKETKTKAEVKLCERCNLKPATHVHYKLYKEKPLKADHRLMQTKQPELFENLCDGCHAKEHGNSPIKSELKRLVIFRDRAIQARNGVESQIRSLERIEYIIPEQWKSGLISWNQLIDQIEKDISKELKTGIHPMTKRLLTIRGIGDMTAAKLQAYIDSSRFDSPSKLNRYCGLDPQFSKRKKGMSAADAKKCGNAYLKKELLGITADGFVKHRTPVYRDLYDSEKKKEIELAKQFGCGVQVPNNGGKTTVKTETHYEKDEKNGGMKAVNGHADSRARKAMMQLFIQHYWAVEREVLGLPTRSPYVQEHLGHTGIIKPQW